MKPLCETSTSLLVGKSACFPTTATVMGQSDPGVTWRHYARLFDRSDVEARVH